MMNRPESRTDFKARAAHLFSCQHVRKLDALGACILILWLASPSLALRGRIQKQAQLLSASPDLQITQVKKLAALSGGAMADVEIRWTAQVPRLTSIDGFDVLLEVHYSDGSRNAARSEQLKPSARSVLLQVATHPKKNSNATLKSFKASVKTRFKVASSLTIVQQITPAQGGSLRASAGSSGSNQPEVVITEARLASQGCPPGQQCVDVRWTASAPRNITINEFTASLDALHKNGARSNDSKTLGGAGRQAKLLAGQTGSEINSIKVSLLAGYFSLDSKTVVKEGAF